MIVLHSSKFDTVRTTQLSSENNPGVSDPLKVCWKLIGWCIMGPLPVKSKMADGAQMGNG